ncbi:YHS domain-containing (seleno)protein [Paracoccus sp. p4-l81]
MTALPLPAAAQHYGNWALSGNDPVAYFDEGEATSGRSDISLEWRGKVYHFTSEDNLFQFESNPHGYSPQFGGLCVRALSQGRRVQGDPQVFVMYQGKLYLMADEAARQVFMADPEAVIAGARDHAKR